MDIDIRKHIINNFKDSDSNDIRESIEAGLNSKDEVVLPGIGVFFELLWNNSSEEEKNIIINKIKESIKKNNQ